MLKLDPTNTELLTQKQIVLNKSIETTEEKLKQLKNIKEEADSKMASGTKISEENYRNLQREIINTQNKLADLKNEASNWTKAGEKLTQFGQNLNKISSKLDNLGNKLTTRLTIPIVGALTAATKEAIEFESAFTGVTKTVEGTDEQLNRIKQGIKDLAKEIPSSTTEISAVAEAAGQLGIQTDNVIEFTRTMIDMGNATNLSADEAATTLARFANVTQMSQSDFSRLGSVIVALGNNFATTESEIASMGMNLGSAGKQVGMSQSQIMALATALSSVGLEAQAGGTAFSKVMVNMQLAVEKGGKDLRNFASVAGMSANEFQKAFKEDATTAIMKFVEGLSQSGERGKSAIKVLDDMGITETRLRDALLRSANASDVMSKAIDLGNKAWEENNALTEEASKRYSTADSQLKIAKNKIKDIATSLGDKLLPSINKILNKTGKWIDKLDKLSDSEKENIVKIGLMVAAIGPLLKVGSSAINIVGNVSKGLGTLSKAISLAHNGIGTATGSAATLAKGLQGLISPVGVVTIGLTAMAGVIAYSEAQHQKAIKASKDFSEQMKEEKNSYEERNKSIDEAAKSNIAQIDSVQRLKDELISLVDENGKVKEGYKSRVDFILKELNEALGTEYKMNGDVIESYKVLQDELDTTIAKKRAEIILNSKEDKYKLAIDEETNALEDLRKAQDNMGMSYTEAKDKYNKYHEAVQKGTMVFDEWIAQSKDMENLKNYISSYESAEDRLKKSIENQKDYQQNYALFVEEEYNKMGNTIKVTTQDYSDFSTETLKETIKEQTKNLDGYKEIVERTGDDVAKKQLQQAQENLYNLAEELKARTSTIGELGENEKEAWKNLANKSYEAYSSAISEMDESQRKEIEEITGVIVMGTPETEEKAKELGEKTVNEFDKSSEAKNKALNTIQGYLNGLDDETKKELLKEAGIEDVDLVLDELNRGDLSEENGRNILEGLWKGLQNGSWQGKILGAASGLAKAVNNAFTGKDGWDEHSPSKKMTKFAENYIKPIAIVMNKRKSSIVSTANQLADRVNSAFSTKINSPQIEDFGNIQGELNNKIVDSTKTIFTTPQIVFNVQELDEARLQQCINYINRKFGSAY